MRWRLVLVCDQTLPGTWNARSPSMSNRFGKMPSAWPMIVRFVRAVLSSLHWCVSAKATATCARVLRSGAVGLEAGPVKASWNQKTGRSREPPWL